MIVEYAGPADRSVGRGWIHKARAWWNAYSDDQGEVKRAVLRTVKAEVPADSLVEFVSWHMDTSTHPTINAWPSVRVISGEEAIVLRRLRAVKVTGCGTCMGPVATHYVAIDGEGQRGVCLTCLRALTDAGTPFHTLAFVKRNGKLDL